MKSNNFNLSQTKFQRFIYGVKLGFKLTFMPEYVFKLHNNYLTKMLRVLGGVSVMLVISGANIIRKTILFYVIFPLAFLQFIYILMICIIKIYYLVYLLRNKKLVRNYTLDKLVRFSVTLVICAKGACIFAVASVTAFILSL